MLQHPARSHGRTIFSSARPRVRQSTRQIANSTLTPTSILRTKVTARTVSSSQDVEEVPQQQSRRAHTTKASGPAATSKPGKMLKMDVLQTPNPLAKAIRDTGLWDGRSLRRAIASEEKEPRKMGRPKKGTAKAKDKGTQTGDEAATKTKAGAAAKRAVKGDKSRVHITNEDLVKDMIDYLKPTLERHQGCDLVSVYPGAGAWTKALHDAVQPRSHLLLEPDEDIYRPFLQPLLDQENVRLVPKSGIVWEDLDVVLTPEYLPNQVALDKKTLRDDPPRNDTLLVSMNLAMFPNKRFGTFQSISRMVVFQLIQTIRTSTLYQKYGQVRMFIWIPDDEKLAVMPRTIGGRRRSAIEGEVSTEYIAEVCGRDIAAEEEQLTEKKKSPLKETRVFVRWPQMDLESARLCKIRMDKRGMMTPPGRETKLMKALDALVADNPNVLKKGISLWKLLDAVGGKGVAQESEFRELLERHKQENFSAGDPNFIRLKALEQYTVNMESAFEHAVSFIQKIDAIMEAYQTAATAAKTSKRTSKGPAKLLASAQQLEAEFDAFVAKLAKYRKDQGFLARDSAHILTRQPPVLGPVLSYDRRPYEPLPAAAMDFFPNVPCALLDIQPKAAHPLLRSMGPGTDNAGDFFDMILGALTDMASGSVGKQMSVLWPGASEGVLPQCKTLTDPAWGGIPLTGTGALTNRCLNSLQLMQILEEFMKWPFRPTHAELMGRVSNDEFDDDDPDLLGKGNAQWQTL